MRQNNLKPVIIFALNRETSVSDQLLLEGLGIEYTPLIGSYKKVTEYAYSTDASNLDKLKELLHETNQECILYLDNQRNAYLCFASDNYTEQKYQGAFIDVSQAVAMKEDAYTYNFMTNTYYIID